ncbi:MAG: amino acid permease [Rickettsiaceae bacterium]|nr:amino acid permease [Rickettsiaceae bacterium]
MNYLKRKSIESVRESSNNVGLAKTLTAFDLIIFGLGAIIGSGVFALTGLVAAKYAGPAVTLSYAIAGFTCIFVALVYTELAAMLPTSGSVYTYSYVAFGELAAWLTGSILILELCFGAATVSSVWSSYLQGILESTGILMPKSLSTVYSSGGMVDILAICITFTVGFILFRGGRDSKRVNTILVFVKMAAVTAFIVSALPYFKLKNWDNFMPFGFNNVLMGSSMLFFSFTGFGSLASLADECKNPKRDLMYGIIGSLVLSTTVYVIVGALATGIVPYYDLNNAQPLAKALRENGNNFGSVIVATGAICGMTTVVMMNIYAQSRIFFIIAKDGLLPKIFSQVQKNTGNPQSTIILFTIVTAVLSGFFPFELLAKLSCIGALIDYTIVSIIVLIFRFTYPDVQRPFRCPMIFVVAPVAILASGYLLSKQIFDDDWLLLFAGQLLAVYLLIVLLLYGVRSMSAPHKAL